MRILQTVFAIATAVSIPFVSYSLVAAQQSSDTLVRQPLTQERNIRPTLAATPAPNPSPTQSATTPAPASPLKSQMQSARNQLRFQVRTPMGWVRVRLSPLPGQLFQPER